ncbi:12603_t:CDS:1, partial [Dentiscutata heterogama]
VFRNLFDVLELFSGSFLENLSERGSKMSKSSLRHLGIVL